MSEPLRERQIREAQAQADQFAAFDYPYTAMLLRELIAEVRRLQAQAAEHQQHMASCQHDAAWLLLRKSDNRYPPTVPTLVQATEDVIAELARERQQAEVEKAQAESDSRIFRRLLWVAHSKGLGYGDDGEMQDCAKVPMIDFKRDPASVIQSKIVARNLAAMKESEDAR